METFNVTRAGENTGSDGRPEPMRFTNPALLILVLAAASLCGGCGTLPSGRAWGEEATITPGWTRVKEAAQNAARDPWVWGPLAAAAALQINDLDRQTSDWAREHTPVFGSEMNALDWSDRLRSTSTAAWLVTLLATPGGDRPEEWLVNKVKGAAVEAGAIALTGATTIRLKEATGRERPDEFDRKSFPSGHASASAVHGQLARFNLDSIPMRPALRRTADIGINVLMLGTGWARVEGGRHFPSDVLAGFALGTFFSSFATRAFLADVPGMSFAFDPAHEGALLEWRIRF
jgi:membrane-associated phospholipid phosphatase